jgi:ATPase family associated with various cellular activities (AAA)
MSKTDIVFDLSQGDPLAAVFIGRARERSLRFSMHDTWCTDRQTLEDLTTLLEADVLLDNHRKNWEGLVLDLQHAIAWISLNHRAGALPAVSVTVHGLSRHALRLEVARLKELLPPADEPLYNGIDVGFWYRGPQGAAKVQRALEAPSWAESAGNYPPVTRQALEPLMSDLDAVIAGGRLLLWHGAPGTGKTSALRTLARENHTAIGVEYVLDPEALFGRDAGYFVSVLFDNQDDDDDDDDGQAGHGKTRVLVLEDCDELLSADAKERSGQGLARLLNLVDGLIGQGLKVGVLITTNEPLGGFHPAVSRPGRCGAAVSFELFTADEAGGWLAGHGSDARALGKVSLAELFAIREGRRPAEPRERIGFVVSRR